MNNKYNTNSLPILKADIIAIKNETIELNNLIDIKCLNILETNEVHNDKILKYKLMMENIIIEYHKICMDLLKNN